MWGGHWMFGGFMGMFWIAGLIALFFLVKLMVQPKSGDQKSEESALEILKKRYAKGEIGRDEFEQKRKDL
jgi:putative membrane protein